MHLHVVNPDSDVRRAFIRRLAGCRRGVEEFDTLLSVATARRCRGHAALLLLATSGARHREIEHEIMQARTLHSEKEIVAIVMSPDDREMADAVQALGLRMISSESTNLCDEISRIPTPSRDLNQSMGRGHTLLTSREKAVLFGIRAGLPLKEIAHNLCISPNTVSTFKARIMLKLGVSSTVELWRINPAREQGRQAQARELDRDDNVPER